MTGNEFRALISMKMKTLGNPVLAGEGTMTDNLFGEWLTMKKRILRTAALAAAALALGGCGGGGGGGSTTAPEPLGEEELAALRADPRVAQLDGILGRADALLFSSLRSRWSLRGGGATLSGALAEPMDCDGGDCTGRDGTGISVGDLTGPADAGIGLTGAELGSRGGFDTMATRGGFDVTESIPGVTVTAGPSIASYGFWGEYGFAALEIGSGPLSGTVDGTAFRGDFSQARAYAAGGVSGSNPAGQGNATWSGIAEASPTGTYGRLTGTATVTVPDLSMPRVSVAIDVPGHEIGEPGWTDMPLENGSFAAGTAGTDRLSGNFHGSGHEEVWGVFDTADWLGVFGARRQP